MESDWVRIYPYLGLKLPNHPVTDDYKGVSESKEIYEYFKSISPDDIMKSFIKFYSNLPNRPKYGQSKMSQVIESLRIIKLAKYVKSQMDAKRVKR